MDRGAEQGIPHGRTWTERERRGRERNGDDRRGKDLSGHVKERTGGDLDWRGQDPSGIGTECNRRARKGGDRIPNGKEQTGTEGRGGERNAEERIGSLGQRNELEWIGQQGTGV